MIINNNISLAILSIAVKDADALAEVTTKLEAHMFSGIEQKAFSILKGHFDRGMSIDGNIFSQEIIRLGGSKAFADKILSIEVTICKLDSYLESFRMSVCVNNVMLFKGKIDSAVSTAQNKDDLISDLSREFDTVTSLSGGVKDDVVSLADYLPQYQEEQAAISTSDGLLGIPTGIALYDKITSGLCKTDLIVLGGRPAMGKTSLALSLLFKSIKSGKQGLFFSLEMPKEQIMHKLISMYSGIPLTNVREAKLSERQQSAYMDAINFISSINFHCSDKGGSTFSEIRRKAITLHNKKKLEYIIIDYLQLINLKDVQGNNKSERLGEVTAGLKALAKDLKLPIILLSQLSRDVEQRADKRPMPSDLRESGAIEQDADLILFVYRDVVYNVDTKEPNKAELIIAKQRNGPTGVVPLNFVGQQTLFTNYNVN